MLEPPQTSTHSHSHFDILKKNPTCLCSQSSKDLENKTWKKGAPPPNKKGQHHKAKGEREKTTSCPEKVNCTLWEIMVQENSKSLPNLLFKEMNGKDTFKKKRAARVCRECFSCQRRELLLQKLYVKGDKENHQPTKRLAWRTHRKG